MANKKNAVPKLRDERAFQSSPKTSRTPPKVLNSTPIKPSTKKSAPKDTSVYLCQICAIEDDVQKIRCDVCMLWYHFQCANVHSQVMQQDTWLCDKCKASRTLIEKTIDKLFTIGTEHPSESQTPAATNPESAGVSKDLGIATGDSTSVNQTIQANPAEQLSDLAGDSASVNQPAQTNPTEQLSNTDQANQNENSSVAQDQSKNVNPPISSKGAKSRKCGSVTSSANRRLSVLALQRLEEQRQLIEQRDEEYRQQKDKRDEEYLRQKYALLEDDAMSNLSFDDQEVERAKFESVRLWTENTQGAQYEELPSAIYANQYSDATFEGGACANVTAINLDATMSRDVNHPATRKENLPGWLINPKPAETNSQRPSAHKMTTDITGSNNQNLDPATTTAISQGVNTYQRDARYDFPPAPVSTTQQMIVPVAPASSTQQMVGPVTSSELLKGSGQTNINSQLQLLGATNTTIGHTLNADQNVNNVPMSHALGTNNPMQIGVSQSTLIATNLQPSVGTLQPQIIGAIPSTLPNLYRQATTGTTTAVTGAGNQVQPATSVITQHVSQVPIMSHHTSASQVQFLGSNQLQVPVTSQHQLLNVTQPQLLNANQGLPARQAPHLNQTSNIGQPYVSGTSLWNASSIYQPPPMTNTGTYASSSQPVHASQSAYVTNSSNQGIGNSANTFFAVQSTTANDTTPARLTAEQIAARHVEKELPNFDGNPRHWGLFISAYENANLSCAYSNSENLSRLKRCLKPPAVNNVNSLLLHKDSVPQVIETLRILYGLPEHVVEISIEDVRKLPAPKEDDLRSIVTFAMAIQGLSNTIQSTGALEHLRNPDLIKSIVGKLPSQHQLNWAFYKQTIGDATLTHLGDWLYNIAAAVSRVVSATSSSMNRNNAPANNRRRPSQDKSGLFINSQMETKVDNKKPTYSGSKFNNKRICPACSNDKCTKLENCKKFRDASQPERWTIVKKSNICGRCFGYHNYMRCHSDRKCLVEGCSGTHHTLLHKHGSNVGAKSNEVPKSATDQDKKKENSTCNSQRSKFSQRVDKFRIVPVMFYNKGKKIQDYAYLDDGSNMTTMEDSLADELELTGSTNELCIEWAFEKTHSVTDSRTVSVKMSGYFENAPCFNVKNIRTVKRLHLPTQSITTSWLERYPHFKNVPISTYENAKPRMLIGLQYSRLITSLETIEGQEKDPIVCRTRLGWVVQGPTYEEDSIEVQKFSVNMCMCQSSDNELHQLVKDYFTIEHLGIKVPESNLESKELQRARQILETTTVKKGDRYEAGLLWKEDKIELPESYNLALKRLVCLEAKMEKDPILKANLHGQIKQFVTKGYIRKLSADEIKNCKHPVWYLPTFPVFNPKKPEKVRLVWDGAAKVKGTSLNSKLLAGPDDLVPLPELLRRFRERKVAVTGDIAEMYHQVKVPECDQHVQRFLWRDDPSKEPEIYVMMVMTFGSKCSPSTAQHVKNLNAKKFQVEHPRAVEAIVQNHYVDDMIDCVDTVDDAEKLVKEVQMIHRAGGFNIRNFASNSKSLLERIGESVKPQNKDLNMGIELGRERVLGMFWDTSTDTFTYSLQFTGINQKMLSGVHCPTKREVLRILMSVFDPLGLIANFLVYGKILLQEIWRTKIEWDEKLPATLQQKWMNWLLILPNVEKLHIPRWYSVKLVPQAQLSIQLHTFVDASVEACAAAVYLRIEDKDGVDCCLVSAKTKVAPTKQLTVPRLELQAAVIGTRLAGNVIQSQTIKIDKHVFWTDSQTVMAWINSETRRYNQFVSFRIGEIIEATDPIQWRWVPTKHNVADEATKSKNIPTLDVNSRWFKAPTFLYDNEMDWFNHDKSFTTEEELRPCFVMSISETPRNQLIDLERFSQWNRLLRTQAYVLRFAYNVRNVKESRKFGELSQEELIQAEIKLYQRAQRDVFFDEILVIKHNQTAAHKKDFEKSSELRNLSPYLDEHNVLRMKGRIDAAESIPQDTKRPIILPRRHKVTKLLVDSYHRRYKHINHQTAINEIRQKYVIPALRVVMKGIRTSCQRCKNAAATTRIPEMAALPQARLAIFTRPFTFTGVDYFGPYSVKVNRSVVPKYGVLFTCLTTRAIHLEVADYLTTESCIEAVIRFSARKGMAREFYSDNGTNFHGADNELKKEFAKLDQNAIESRFTSSEQKWTFITPTASHMGGAWERLIRIVKSCLKQMLATKRPTYEMLVTLMAEVENIVNSRPLTHISLDSNDDEALTPNHFLFGSSNAMKPIGETTPRDLNQNDWRAIHEMAKHFWHRFVLEYLPDLTKRTKWFKQVEPIKVGDVVVNIDEKQPRNTWPKGIVDEVIVAKDGCIRQVMVRFEKSILKRPVSKLAILDVKLHNEEDVKLDQMGPVNGGKDVAQRSIDDNTDSSEINSTKMLPDELSTNGDKEGKSVKLHGRHDKDGRHCKSRQEENNVWSGRIRKNIRN